MSNHDLIPVTFLKEYGSRAEGETVSYDPASAHNVVESGDAEYVDADYVYVPADSEDSEEQAPEGSLAQVVLTPADAPSESELKAQARADAKARAEAAKAAEAAQNADAQQ